MSENLAYACFDCNRAKGSDIASIDPDTGILTPLFSPRTQVWSEHFRVNGPVIEARTAISRVTVRLLRMNLPVRVAIRESLMRAGHYTAPYSAGRGRAIVRPMNAVGHVRRRCSGLRSREPPSADSHWSIGR